MGNQFTQLVFGYSIVKCALQMAAELIRALQCDQGGASDQAAIAL
jgi:hypothetical protein